MTPTGVEHLFYLDAVTRKSKDLFKLIGDNGDEYQGQRSDATSLKCNPPPYVQETMLPKWNCWLRSVFHQQPTRGTKARLNRRPRTSYGDHQDCQFRGTTVGLIAWKQVEKAGWPGKAERPQALLGQALVDERGR